METQCICFFDKDGSITKDMKLTAGDDATDCHWMTVDLDNSGFKLYASHRRLLKLAVAKVAGKAKVPEKAKINTNSLNDANRNKTTTVLGLTLVSPTKAKGEAHK